MTKIVTIPLVASPRCTIPKLRYGACFQFRTPTYLQEKTGDSNSS